MSLKDRKKNQTAVISSCQCCINYTFLALTLPTFPVYLQLHYIWPFVGILIQLSFRFLPLFLPLFVYTGQVLHFYFKNCSNDKISARIWVNIIMLIIQMSHFKQIKQKSFHFAFMWMNMYDSGHSCCPQLIYSSLSLKEKKKIPRFIKVLEPSKGRKTDMFINLQLVICRVSARCHYARPPLHLYWIYCMQVTEVCHTQKIQSPLHTSTGSTVV